MIINTVLGVKIMSCKKIIGDPVVIGGRQLSLSRAIRAGDFIFLTGQVPFKNGEVMTSGTIEEQTIAVIEEIKSTLSLEQCELNDVVKAMVWLTNKKYFPGFNEVFSKYFPKNPPTRSAVVNDLLVDVKVEIEVIAYKPLV